ncbi:hypothetical protein HHL25_09610 [Rhizobium sp. S-51]|uniref:Uncharacterized protein n=1 Tax=Rhizobium terricola TaxID=2728849 RepID=A0A7Y0AVQ3_9HYPH|nr:hypothetical protein [Rhizobium terricola]NML74377.1 hypothetical protein [Rhizobium terricola]
MDGQHFIYTPYWLRVVAIVCLTAILALSIVVTIFYIHTNKEDWILLALSAAQVSASGLVVVLFLFFSARDVGSTGLQHKADRFLCTTFPSACALIDFPVAEPRTWGDMKIGQRFIRKNREQAPTEVLVRHNMGENAAFYRIGKQDRALTMRLQANVYELTVSYYFPAASQGEVEGLKDKLDWALQRYTEIGGYAISWYFSKEEFDSRTYASVHLTRVFPEDFLENEKLKLFFCQDVAASTRSLIKECGAQRIATTY